MSKDKDISLAFVTLNNSEDLIRTYLSIKNLSRIIQEIIVVDSSNNVYGINLLNYGDGIELTTIKSNIININSYFI